MSKHPVTDNALKNKRISVKYFSHDPKPKWQPIFSYSAVPLSLIAFCVICKKYSGESEKL